MKKISTLLLSSLFSLSLLAYDGSRLSISTTSTSMDLKFEVDGRKMNMQNNSVTLSNIDAGSHNVRIYRLSKRSGFGKRQEIIYAGSVFVKRGFETEITVNKFGKIFIDESRIDNRDDVYNNGNGSYDENEGWDDMGYSSVMSARDFDQVKQMISKEWLESNRLVSAQTIIDKNMFTTQQVKEMMLLFTFENNRLDVAKAAYRKTVDKQNYYLLNDALTFSSTKDDLARFIRESR